MIKKVLLSAALFVAFWVGFQATSAIWDYFRLSGKAVATLREVKVKEISDSEYAVKMGYIYSFQGKLFKGSCLLSKPYHLNRPSAEQAAQKAAKQSWVVYYDPQRPRKSSLEHLFPYKEAIYALVAIGVVGHLFIVGEQGLTRFPKAVGKS